MVRYTVERTNGDVLTLRHHHVASGWEQRYLLMADVHFDSPFCDRRLLTKHLDQARDQDAGIMVFGDWFDAMGGRNDRRATKSGLRKQDSEDNYFDRLVYRSAEYLEPYAPWIALITPGNHCKAVLQHNETDLMERLCRELGVPCMGYSGFIRFMFAAGNNSGKRGSRTLYWHHGAGGGGPVTKGVIATNRRAASVEADIFVQGHIHEAWVVENVMATLSDSGQVRYRPQYHVCLPTYKDEYKMAGGYHVEKGRPPKPLGAWWLVWRYDGSQPGKVGCTFERAL